MIDVTYGVEFEANRIRDSLAKQEWFKQHGYKPILPKGLVGDFDNSSFIEEVVEKEFNTKDYEDAKTDLVKQYLLVEKEFKQKVLEKLKLELPRDIIVILTKYGVGGSYVLPNKVVVNIVGNQINKPILEVLKHEIVHLVLEREVRQKELTHSEKEKLVNDFFK